MTKIGRPSLLTEKLTANIMARLSNGESMRTVCRDPKMPSMDTMWRWIRENRDFSERYARAKQESSDAMAEDIMDIADEPTDKEGIQRNRLRVDTRKWLMSKHKPKKYGDFLKIDEKSEITHKWGNLTDAQLDKALKERENKAS